MRTFLKPGSSDTSTIQNTTKWSRSLMVQELGPKSHNVDSKVSGPSGIAVARDSMHISHGTQFLTRGSRRGSQRSFSRGY